MSALTPTISESSVIGKGVFSPLVQVQRLLTSFLKWRFSKLPVDSYRYDLETDNSPEQKNAEIYIGLDTPIETSKTGSRPCITMGRSQAAFQGIGIGDLAFNELATGMKSRMDLIPTNIQINVLSVVPNEAENLAWFIQEQIFSFREEIVKREPSLMYIGSKAMIGPPSPAGSLVDSSTEFDWVVVVMSYPAYLQHVTHRLPLNKKIIRGIDLTMTTTPRAQPVDPVIPLQGTAVSQPALNVGSSQPLPQTGSDEAQSTEPLSVEIQAR